LSLIYSSAAAKIFGIKQAGGDQVYDFSATPEARDRPDCTIDRRLLRGARRLTTLIALHYSTLLGKTGQSDRSIEIDSPIGIAGPS
jgi:hypothetical protein